MRQGSVVTYPSALLRMYLHGDHPSTRFARSGQALGSTNVASSDSGALVSRQTYFPYGAPRTSEGALPSRSPRDFSYH
jgi:hypothetical protein